MPLLAREAFAQFEVGNREELDMGTKSKLEILHLNVHHEFFAAIATEKKLIEYRAQTPYWRTRLDGRRVTLYRVV
jgi:hypothetical protein